MSNSEPARRSPRRRSVSSSSPRDSVLALREEVGKVVVGQDGALSGLVAALLVRGHVLLEGVPGVAKTLLVKTLAASLDLEFKRVQFTPDLMPSDVVGQTIFEQRGSSFRFRPGPVFTNLLLADEVNRTPPKTQAALLEAMEERQVSVEGEAKPLPEPFLVVATQNPIEYEGTYPLPEAQLDRFLFKLLVPYPTAEQEQAVPACVPWPGPGSSPPLEPRSPPSAASPRCRATSSRWRGQRGTRPRCGSVCLLGARPRCCTRRRRGPGWRARSS
jgi:MoxR-like ATPase